MGFVILVGAGPGDPGLLTLKGKEALTGADCIIYDRLASPELLEYAKESCELIYVGKANHHHTMCQEQINQLLVQKASEGKCVVRLKGGDPYVFGRGGEEALYLKEHGISVEVIPGVSSSVAALADAGIPITHRGLSKGFQVITAHSRKDAPAEIDYSQLLDETVTLVFLMGLAHVGEIAEGLMKAGRSADTPAAVISCGTTVQQRKCVGTLGNIDSLVREANLPSPSIITVGQTVLLADELNFFEHRPLFSRRYLLPCIEPFLFSWNDTPERTNEVSELGTALRSAGADVSPLKIGRIVPIRIADADLLDALHSDWLLFTSANGVRAFLWNLQQAGLDIRSLGNSKIGVVGAKTAKVFREAAINADLIPEEQTGRGLCEALLEKILPHESAAGPTVTLFAAKESNPEVKEMLMDQCVFRKIICYENQPETDPMAAEKLSGTYDGVFFTSASAVKRTCLQTGNAFCSIAYHFYSIGPKCSEALKKAGILQIEEAPQASYRGLLSLVLKVTEK